MWKIIMFNREFLLYTYFINKKLVINMINLIVKPEWAELLFKFCDIQLIVSYMNVWIIDNDKV